MVATTVPAATPSRRQPPRRNERPPLPLLQRKGLHSKQPLLHRTILAPITQAKALQTPGGVRRRSSSQVLKGHRL